MGRGRQASGRPRELTDDEVRVAVAMRELRRGASMQAYRARLYGSAPTVLDIGQHDALDVVIALGEARMGDLATALRIDPSTATRAVARLEAAGLVERRRADADARAVVVAATEAGRDLHAAIGDAARSTLRELFARFDQKELSTLADLLGRLVAGLDELAGLPRGSVSD